MEWRHPSGAVKDVSCRVALLKLARRGAIELPAARAFTPGAAPSGARTDPPPALASCKIEAPLAALGQVWLEQVAAGQPALSRLWWELVREHHPLGVGKLCGAQLRYLVRCDAGVLGALSFSAPAWALAPRERWIGWDVAARQQRLPLVVNNSRMLILPSVRVPNLASHVLGLALRRLRGDWHQRYGVSPVLVETFVDASHAGTCYRAANWQLIGQTQGRGRQDQHHRKPTGAKSIWVYPLHKQCQQVLRGSAGQPVQAVAEKRPTTQATEWAQQEFGGCRLGDERLEQRLLSLARDFYARPGANLPQACASRAKTRAAYRFFDHKATLMQTLLQPHYSATHQRMAAQPVVLAVQDTTSLNYTAHAHTEGLGPIGTTVQGSQGLMLHSTLVFDVQGTPLGFIDAQCWARDPSEFGKKARRAQLPIEQKESAKWLRSYEAAAAAQAQCPRTLIVSVGDREADIYELFEQAARTPHGPKLLVRAMHDRALQDPHDDGWEGSDTQASDTQASDPGDSGKTVKASKNLWPMMLKRDVDATHVVQLPRQGGRAARKATLEIRFASVQLKPPKRLAAGGAVSLQAWAVLAQETRAPAGVQPLEWMLLSTVAVESVEQACERLMWYARRWGIEVMHRTLKSGCNVEQRQLGQADRLEACLAIDLVVAWRIHRLSKLARETPTLPCTEYFDDDQWQALHVFKTRKQPKAEDKPNLREMARRVAALGGFLGRKSDGEPGTQTLWLGIQRLDDITMTWRAAMDSIAATQGRVSGHERYG